REVDARRLLARNVDVGRGDEARQPHRSLRIAVDQIAELPRKYALRHDQRGRDVADLVVDLDIEVVDRAAQVFHRRENGAKRGALRLFGVQVGIAALDVVVLARGVGAVVGVAVAGIHAEQIRPWRAFDDRHFYFAKDFLDGELAGKTDGRPALSREVEGRESGVGFEIELLDTTLDA